MRITTSPERKGGICRGEIEKEAGWKKESDAKFSLLVASPRGVSM